jgi:apolipoprotein N-acyltransferase
MVLTNGFLAIAIEKGLMNRSWKQPFALVAALLFVTNLGFGAFSLTTSFEPKETFVAAAIQGNIASGDKWADDSVETSLNIYEALTHEAVLDTGASLVVWPETVITATLNRRPAVRDRIADIASEMSIYLAVGSYYDETVDGDLHSYNAIYLFAPDGTVSETVYQKRHLVPFGEYLPITGIIKTVLPFLAEMNLFSNDLTNGSDSALWDTELGKIGALVCFDSIYETLTLDSVRDGAEIMILSTNDSWYKDSAAVYQHNGHAVLRAIETGRSFVRAANTGISSIIEPNGEIVTLREPLVKGYAAAEVSTHCHTTPYSVIGNLIVWLSLLYLAVLVFLRIRDAVAKRKIADHSDI